MKGSSAVVLPKEKATILDALAIERCVVRLAHEIFERSKPLDQVVLLGIRERGDLLAKRLALKIKVLHGVEVHMGELDITFYRDDLRQSRGQGLADPGGHVPKPTRLPCDIDGKIVILVDDVLYTGRSVRAALDALIDYGRPSKIQLAVLIDRGHREFPIHPDFVGKNIPSAATESVQVRLNERDGEDRAILLTSV